MMWAALILAAPAALPGVGTAARPFGVRPAASPRMSTAEQASAAAAVDAPTNVPAWLETYRTTPAEESYTVECAALPADLKGTLYRNGPSKFEIGDSPVVHPFDGDGMLAALTFDGEGRVHFRNRFVRTRGFVLEEREGKRLFANAFGNPLPAWSGGLSPKNVANTNVLYWGGRLLALWEAGKPHLMDEVSLATSRESDVGGVLKAGEPFSAHPRYDARTGRLVNFAYKPNPLTGTEVSFYEFDADFRPVDPDRPRLRHTLPGFVLMHDFVITENYYVVSAPPTKFSGGLDALLGRASAAACIEFDWSKPSIMYLVPRAGGAPIPVEVDPHFNFHFANAFEDEAGRVVVDTIRATDFLLGAGGSDSRPVWETTDYERDVPKSTLCRYTLDPASRTGSAATELCPRYVDFPTIDRRCSGRPYRWAYCATGAAAGAAAPFQGCLKLDTQRGEHEIWLGPPELCVGEWVLAPRAGARPDSPEDDGYLLTLAHDTRRNKASLLVLDASRVSAGPVATVELDSFLSTGLHGTFVPELVPSAEKIESATKLMNMYARKSREWNQVDGSFTGLGFKQLFQKGVDGR